MKAVGKEAKVPAEVCASLIVTGIVQGVGFRPFVYSLASQLKLKGQVANTGQGVEILVQGLPEAVGIFIKSMRLEAPPLASIDEVKVQNIPPGPFENFKISVSAGNSRGNCQVPPDVALCSRCAAEIADLKDRRHKYAFTNCTDCGPRYTIVRGLPYDRELTSMAAFNMCGLCRGEYTNTADRRFHAQPVACPRCGPHITAVAPGGGEIEGDWLETAHSVLEQGKILAVKGLGGYHLACDAGNQEALAELRRRKARPGKPFAIMCRDMQAVRRHCLAGQSEERLLLSAAAPILLLSRLSNCTLPQELAPGMKSLGVMLPYTPLHSLIMSGTLDTLVMTSGNISGLPLVKDNEEALLSLGGIADCFLQHNREIVNRCDDSVMSWTAAGSLFVRRSRGFVPVPVKVPAKENGGEILAVGGDKKNTFCVLKGDTAYPGPHLGEMDTQEGRNNFLSALDSFLNITGAVPQAVACDLHPWYYSGELALQISARLKIPVLKVQHHHAHMASCMAENGLAGEVTGVILDGTGYGDDGNSWGFEIIKGDYYRYTRLCHLAYAPLAGGDRAIKTPWVTAAGFLISSLGAQGIKASRQLFGHWGQEYLLVEKMIERGFNTPLHGGCGRLFDTVAAITGLCSVNTYDGEAALKLSEMARTCAKGAGAGVPQELLNPYPFILRDNIIDPGPALAKILSHCRAGRPVESIARGFHHSLVHIIIEVLGRAAGRGAPGRVVLSGGCWNNTYLLELARRALLRMGYLVYTHTKVPPGDGGLALGQCMAAQANLCQGYK